MSNRLRMVLIGVLVILTLINNAPLLFIDNYHPDSAINGAFVLLMGAVAASFNTRKPPPGGERDSDESNS
jgi:uncharacterized membrane protein YoaK (UPF0700 family)